MEGSRAACAEWLAFALLAKQYNNRSLLFMITILSGG